MFKAASLIVLGPLCWSMALRSWLNGHSGNPNHSMASSLKSLSWFDPRTFSGGMAFRLSGFCVGDTEFAGQFCAASSWGSRLSQNSLLSTCLSLDVLWFESKASHAFDQFESGRFWIIAWTLQIEFTVQDTMALPGCLSFSSLEIWHLNLIEFNSLCQCSFVSSCSQDLGSPSGFDSGKLAEELYCLNWTCYRCSSWSSWTQHWSLKRSNCICSRCSCWHLRCWGA